MIIDQIYVLGFSVFEAKNNRPISIHVHGVETLIFSFQRVKVVSWSIHISCFCSSVKAVQNASDFICMSRLNTRLISCLEKLSQPSVLKVLNRHEILVYTQCNL